MATADEMLSETELELAKVALDMGDLINSASRDDRRIWIEESIAPMTDTEVFFCTLRTRLGDENPKSGFTLWMNGKAYRVTFEQYK
jgi:hypothetical protein